MQGYNMQVDFRTIGDAGRMKFCNPHQGGKRIEWSVCLFFGEGGRQRKDGAFRGKPPPLRRWKITRCILGFIDYENS